MKIRYGFVSNSSSTSFLINIPKYMRNNTKSWLKLLKFKPQDILKRDCFNHKERLTAEEAVQTLIGQFNRENLIKDIKDLATYFSYSVYYSGAGQTIDYNSMSIRDLTEEERWSNGKPTCSEELLRQYIRIEGEEEELYKNRLGRKLTEEEKEARRRKQNKLWKEKDKIRKEIGKEWAINWLKENNFSLDTHQFYVFSHEDKGDNCMIFHDGVIYQNIITFNKDGH